MRRLKVLLLVGIACTPALAVDNKTTQMEVLSVFAPGNGGNLVTEGQRPPSFDSQVSMYRDLPTHLSGLTDADIHKYFKPALFDVASQDVASVETPRPGVRIVRDTAHNVPHVHADTRDDAMFGIGYARAEDRLWQMEIFRSTWRATSASLLGPGPDNQNVMNDVHSYRVIDYSEAEYQKMFDALLTGYGKWGEQASRDITAYVAGLNAYIDKLAHHPALMPIEYRDRNLKPGRWSVTDVMAMAAYTHVAWGGLLEIDPDANSRVFQQLKQRFGEQAASVFNDLRLAPEAGTPASVTGTADLPRNKVQPQSTAILDLDSFVARQIGTIGGEGVVSRTVNEIPHSFRSNALLLAAENSVTGHPIAVQGPQDPYGTPQIFDSEIAVSAPDFKARGILEISGPYPYVASHGDDYAWSVTIMYPNQSDLFAERLCEPDGRPATLRSPFYKYRGRCVPFTTRVEHRSIAGSATGFTLTSERSVHGPILGSATVDGVPVAVSLARVAYMHEEMDYPAHAQLFSPSAVRSAKDFLNIVADTAYNIGWWYVDRKDIGFVDAGRVPVRNLHVSTDFPVWGTGEWDWSGFDPDRHTFEAVPKDKHPHAINPESGVLAGWNNVSQFGWPVPSYAWKWGDNRVRLLKDPTAMAAKQHSLTIAELVKIHTLAALTDVRAYLYYVPLRKFLGKVTDPDLESILVAVDDWMKGGALREDLGNRGYLDHSPAIAFLDTAWEQLIRTVFEPALGRTMLDEAHGKNNLPPATGRTVLEEAHGKNNLPPTNTSPGAQNGWLDYLTREIEGSTARLTPPSRRYCGRDDTSCRDLIVAGLKQSLSLAREKYGARWQDWRVPTICATCAETDFPSTGDAQPVPPIPWQNRGVYVQVTTGAPQR